MSTPKGRILCTEDNADTRELIIYVLTDEGFEVKCADSAEDALRLARMEDFDLFLVDNWLPGMSGPGFTQQVRQFNSKTPILFYSGAAQQKDKDEAKAAGAQGYLVKPVHLDALIGEVARLIAEARVAYPVEFAL